MHVVASRTKNRCATSSTKKMRMALLTTETREVIHLHLQLPLSWHSASG
jgi:hypothetical protein